MDLGISFITNLIIRIQLHNLPIPLISLMNVVGLFSLQPIQVILYPYFTTLNECSVSLFNEL